MADTKERSVLGLFRTMKIILRLLPRRFCLYVGGLAGRLAYLVDKKHRKLALANLEMALGKELSIEQRKKTAQQVFRNFGRIFLDIIKIDMMKGEKTSNLFTVKGEELLQAALEKGKGVIYFTAHYGNWEILPMYFPTIAPSHVIARALDFSHFEKELHRIRTGHGVNVIYKTDAARQVIRALGKNETVAIVIDQNTLRSQGVFVDFFGKQASTTPALAAFHLRTEAPMIPIFCVPSDNNKYKIIIQKPVVVPLSEDRSQNIRSITQACTKVIEDQIRTKPELWFWFHDRWRSRPIGE